jgi:ABC-type glycerol-3-phosphate transport system substrate-binding protein
VQIGGVTIDISKVEMIVKVFVIREVDMKRIGFYLIMLIGMMLCWGCGDHKITESTETEAGLSEYRMAQLDMTQICGFGKVQDEYVCIGEAENGGYIRLTGEKPDGDFRQEELKLDSVMDETDMITAADMDEAGSMYLAVSRMDDKRDITGRIVKVMPDDTVQILADHIEENVKNIRLTADGYIIGCADGVIQCFSMEGQKKYEIENSDYTDICVAGDKLVVLTARDIETYDISDGHMLETITSFDDTLTEGLEDAASEKGKDALSCSNIMKYDEKSDQIYIMLGTGLFAYKLSDKLGTRLTTFKSADIRYDFVVEDSDTFVAVTGDKSGNKRIVVYSSSDAYAAYNSTKEASDSRTVTVYSLYYTESYENLITWYESDHSDITVQYIWGVDDQNGISEKDAISSLNTQLLAGEGPDVIIMDGLNVKSYENTGVLMDLSQVLDDIQKENPSCLKNVLYTYKNEDGSVYAIPAMETFTAVIGPEAEIRNVTDVQSLVAYINSQDKPADGNDLSFYYLESYFDTLYPVYASEIVDMEEHYDREMLKKFLEDLRLLYDLEMARTTQDQINDWTARFGAYEENIKDNYSGYMSPLFNREWSGRKLAFVDMKTMSEAWLFYSIKEDSMVGMEDNTANRDYDYEPWGTDEGMIYVPNTILAVNSKKENRDSAVEFVKALFSAEVQKKYYGTECGNPVNMDGVRAWNEDALSMGTPGGAVEVGGNNYLNWTYWRTDEYLEDYIDKLSRLCVPSNPDVRIRSMIRENATDYLEGNASLEDTLNIIDKLLNVYLKE